MENAPTGDQVPAVAAAAAEQQAHTIPADVGSMARAGSWLYAAAAIVLAAPVVLPQAEPEQAAGLLAAAAVLGAFAVVMAVAGPRFSAGTFPMFSIVAALLLGAGVVFKGDSGGPAHFELVLLLVVLYSAYFYGRRTLGVQLAATIVAYGAALGAVGAGPADAAHWLVSAGALVAAAILVRRMKERLDELIVRLSEMAHTDFLTGLTNRRAFVERFEYELELARRSGRPLTLLVGDIDRFKDLNDRYGHAQGDKALKKVAEIMDTTRRRIDSAARIGGEEFAMILPFTDAKGGLAVAERVRTMVESGFRSVNVHRGAALTPTAVTISFGVVSFPAHGQTAEAMLHVADQALYAAKRGGRNRSVVHRLDTVPKYAGVPVAPRPE